MGADGHIVIFDWNKVVEHFGQERANELSHGCWNAYRNTLKTPNGSIEVLHYYWGDNCDFTPWEHRKDKWDEWFLLGEHHEPKPWTEEELQEAWWWMVHNAQIGEWEVWT